VKVRRASETRGSTSFRTKSQCRESGAVDFEHEKRVIETKNNKNFFIFTKFFAKVRNIYYLCKPILEKR
jgi:hypothetical protein